MKGFKKSRLKMIGMVLVMICFLTFLIGCNLVTSTTSDNTQAKTIDLQSVESTAGEITVTDVGTTDGQGKNLTIDLFFPDKEGEGVFLEKHELKVYEGAVLRAAVEGLIAGPTGDNLANPLPEGTKLLGINLKNDLAIVDFSKEFSSQNTVSEKAEKISLVNTLTEFTNVNKVKILIEGNEWKDSNGAPFGEMTKIPIDSEGKPEAGQ